MTKIIDFSQHKDITLTSQTSMGSNRGDFWFTYDKINDECEKHIDKIIKDLSGKINKLIGDKVDDSLIRFHIEDMKIKMELVLQKINLSPCNEGALSPGAAISIFKQKIKIDGYEKHLSDKINLILGGLEERKKSEKKHTEVKEIDSTTVIMAENRFLRA